MLLYNIKNYKVTYIRFNGLIYIINKLIVTFNTFYLTRYEE